MTPCEQRQCAGCPHCSPTLASLMRASIKGDFEGAAAQADRILDTLFPKWKAKYASKRVSVSNEVPSPSLDSLIDHVSHPEKHTHDLVKQEAELSAYQQSHTPSPNAIPVPDMTAEIKHQRSK